MSEFTSVLERSGERFPQPPLPLDGVLRRRDGKRRNRRIGAVVVALVIAGAAVLGPLTLLNRFQSMPADRITIDNVGTLALAWTSDDLGSAPVEVPDGIVIPTQTAPTSGIFELAGYRLPCGRGDGLCAPTWSARVGHNALVEPLLVSDGSVFAGGDRGGMQVFPAWCSHPPCDRSWIGPTPAFGQGLGCQAAGHCPVQMLEISDGIAYTTVDPSGLDQLWAFPATCRAARCNALWSASDTGPPAIAGNDRVAVRTSTGVAVFAARCWGVRGPRCTPIWSRATGSAIGVPVTLSSPPLVVGGAVIVPGDDSVLAFRASDGRPLWRGRTGGTPTQMVLDGDLVLAAGGAGTKLFAFPVGCTGSCDPAWIETLPGKIGVAPIVAEDGWVYVASGDTLSAFAPGCAGTCGPAWTARIAGDLQGMPVVVDGVLYVAGSDALDAYDPACATDGSACAPRFTWSPQTGGLRSAPVVVNGTLVIAGEYDLYGLTTGGGGS
jgi:outer membrane protein assembly factor BamB